MKKNVLVAVMAGVGLLGTSVLSHADDSHFYLGGSTGYYKPDGDRNVGNTRTGGVVLGVQFNDRWSAEYTNFVDVGSPGKFDLNAQQINVIRHWGTDVRFLVDFGFTDLKYENQPSSFGYHVGAGLSGFLTNNLELRGDIKMMYYGADEVSDWILSDQNEESYTEAVGTVSLLWHFGREGSKPKRTSAPVLGSSRQPAKAQGLPPIQQREPIQAVEPVVEAPVAQAPVVQQPMVEEPVAARPAPAPAASVPAKSAHILVNFDTNSQDIESRYGAQLDNISNEIIQTNSRAVVEGHTDSQGSESYNKVLSMDRAIQVKRELKKRGVDGQDLTAVGRGESQPVATNETEEGRAQNRRVEVKLYDKE